MARYRLQLAFVLFLSALCVGLYFYDRHNEFEREAAGNKRALDSCLRQNIHRKATNRQTLRIKSIFRDIATRQRQIQIQALEAGNHRTAEMAANIAEEWEKYEKELFRVPIAPCHKIYGR